MAKAPSPLLGYNNNVRHKNRVFHIQTEDSGLDRPHLITHLFADGGRVIKSHKRTYAAHVHHWSVEGWHNLDAKWRVARRQSRTAYCGTGIQRKYGVGGL